MAKQLNVGLNFTANTSQAKQQILELQSTLTKLSLNTNIAGINPAQMKEASSAAKELSIHLNNAFNANTGKLDLSKLDKSLKTSSTNVTELSSKLLNAGSQGQQAFVQLAQAISAADRPVVTLNAKFSSLLTTLKNTARWQLSSSLLHAFIGAYQQAMGYVKDLNASLTDIRIVTGKSIEDMTRFAEEANRAAKALSTTTNEYAQASLIFYQQGLSEEEVAKRTEVTIKMANAAGQTAQTVSDQLTAVWNNFYDGSKSLEYYADVMTALGAATASSTDEIAGGLEKFAAIADTIGLSYEYAASALATITANTRQSEDVVGTALKTIFARIQGLNLGETLDDGTTLNKYSEALQKVGISIFDQAGELKDMDDILDEMGAKWENLNKAQQTALAQTVAGTRQYTQLVALMDNWDSGDSDSMQANLNTAYNAEGTLQDQADIYAESWEAARDRVQASLESIYGQVLDDEFFIDIANGFSSLLDSVSAFIDGIGGIKTILMGIGSVFLSSVANKIQPALMDLKHTFGIVFQSADQQAKRLANEMNKGIQSALKPDSGYNFNDANRVALENAMSMNTAKAKLQAVEKDLTIQEKQRADQQIQMIQMQQQETQEVANRISKLKEEKEAILDIAATESLTTSGQKTYSSGSRDMDSFVSSARQGVQNAETTEEVDAAIAKLTEARQAASQYQTVSEQIISSISDIDNAFRSMGSSLDLTPSQQQLQQLNDTIQTSFKGNLADIKANLANVGDSATGFESIRNQLDLLINSMPSVISQSDEMQAALTDIFTAKTPEQMAAAIGKVEKALENTTVDSKQFAKVLKEINPERFRQLETNLKKTKTAEEQLIAKQKELNKLVQNFNPKHVASGIEGIVKTASGLGQVAMAAQAVRSIFQAWSNQDLSFGEKLTTTIISISMALPALKRGLGDVTTGFMDLLSIMSASLSSKLATQILTTASATDILTGKITAENLARQTGISLETAELMIKQAKVNALIAEATANGTLTSAETAESLATLLGISADEAAIVASKMAAGATLAEALAEAGLTTMKTGGIAATVMQIYTKGLETGARWANVVAMISEQTAMAPLLVITLLLVAAMAALALIIWGVVSAINAIIDAYNADAIAAEKAESAAKELAQAYNEAKTSYEDMIAAMEEYQTARDGLDSLTKGTKEYIDALKEANRQALELINTYDRYLSSDDYRWENGELIIDDEALKNAQYKKSLEVDTAFAASAMGAANAKELRAVSDQTNLKRSYYDGNIGTATLQAMGSSMAATLLPFVNTILAPVLATASYATYAAKQGEEYIYGKGVDAAMELYREGNKNLFDSQQNLTEALGEIGIKDEDLINALWENKDALQELGSKFDAAELAGRTAAQENARNFIENSSYGNSRYADDMAHMVGNQYYERQQVLEEEISKSMKKKAGLKAAADAYFVNSGIASQAGFKVDKYDKKNGTVKYSYIGEDGKREEKEVSAEFIAQMQAATEIQNELAESCRIVNNSFLALDGQLGSTNKMLNEGMKHFLTTGDTTELTKEQYDEMAKMSESELLKYLSDIGINNDTVTNFGYEDMADFIEAMNLSNVGESWGQYNNLTSLTGGENLTLAGAENITNAITELTDFFGEEIGTEMLNLSDAMAQSLDEASQAAFWEELGKIEDFSDAEAWEAFLENMKESGDLTEEEAKALENYVDTATLAAKATRDLDFDSLVESVKSLTDVMDTIREGTRDISQEQYDALVAQGIDTSKFAKTIDGWRYLGDTGEFATEISEAIKTQFTNARENFNHLADTARQASANLTAAKEALDEAKEAGDAIRATKQEEFLAENRSKIILANIMSHIQEIVSKGIQTVWQKICDVCVSIYDFFAKVYNWIGENLSTLWNNFASWLEGFLNDVADVLVDILEFLGVDTSDFEGFDFGRMNFEAMKTSDEIMAEEEAAKRQEEYNEAVQAIIDATPDLVNSIEASADYLSEQELMAGRSQIESDRAQAQSDYDAAVATYGENSQEALMLKDLLDSYDKQLAAYDKALASKAYGEIVAEGFDMKEVEAYADMLRETHKELELTEEEALKMAVAQKKMDRGMKTLVDTYEDWNDALESGDLEAKSKALTQLREGMSDLTGIDMSQLPASFFESEVNAKLLKEAINGNVDSLRLLMGEATKEIMLQMDLDPTTESNLQTLIDNTLNAIDVKDLEVGATLNDTGMYQAFQALLDSGAVTVDEMNTILSGIGFSPVIEYKEMTLGEAKKLKQKSYIQTADGEYTEVTTEMNLKDDAKVWVPVINADKTTVKAPPAPSAYSGNNGGGGGGSKPKKTADARQKKSEVVDRYKEVTDQLEKTNHLMSMNSTLAEGLWGSARSKKMRENLALQKQEIGLLKEKLAETKKYLNVDRQELNSAAAVLGLNVQIDGDGAVTNIESVQEAMWKKREQLLDSFGSEIDETEQETLDAFDKYIERFEEAYDQYEETRQENMATEEEILEAQLEAQQIMFDDLNQTLEENISLIEKDLELVEYYLSKVEDDFYGMAEAAALMVGNLSSSNPGEGGQLGSYLDSLAAQKKYKEELDAAYAAGDINQAQYIEGLMNCQSAMIEQLSNINELDKTMKGYYGETLQAAQEELSKYTDMMDHHTEVLDHYLSLLDLIGASKDWTRMKTVLQTQVDVAENSAAVSKANYEMLAQEAEEKRKAWEDAQNNSNLSDYEKSVIQQQWIDAQTAANEAQNQMLEDAEAWAQALKSLLETELAELADILEKSLSGEFGSLDNMMTAMERASSLQEEYLTTTNQIYETNKLMRTAQQEIDKTTNSVAKRRLKQYIDETEQLQNKNKLSQFELDIQKAKYDLLVAEIALEEAQQAKSTVRLQRDSEGNFGYVYTADQNEIAKAQQELEDAQNALYNTGLEGANKYAESYAQTIQEMNDAITELTEKWQNGEIASKEEYEQQMLALKKYYGEKLLQYSELHSIALTADSRIIDEAWTRDFAHMTTQTQQWMTNVDRYVQGVEGSMERYQNGVDRVEYHAGLDLNSLKKKTEDIKTANDELAKSITKKDGVLDAIKAEITQVSDLTLKYAALRKEIQGTVDDYEDLLKRLGVDIDTAASGQPPLGTTTPETTTPETTVPETTVPETTVPGTIKVGGKINAGSAQIYDYAGDTSGERQYFRSDPIYNVLKEQGDWIQVRHHKLSSGITGWFKKGDVAALNTGGYTGDWSGSYGKLAFLHQKELVLNAQDTENLLTSMEVMERILQMIDLQSASSQLGGILSSPGFSNSNSQILEQSVHIEASFPGVQDRNEIEEAFNNLINKASQYANRK